MTEKEEKQLEKIRAKMSQLRAQERRITSRNKQRQQKERTRRLIKNGALAEKYLNCENMPSHQFELVLKRLAAVQKIILVYFNAIHRPQQYT